MEQRGGELFDKPAHDLTPEDLAGLTVPQIDAETLSKIHDAEFIPLEDREW